MLGVFVASPAEGGEASYSVRYEEKPKIDAGHQPASALVLLLFSVPLVYHLVGH